MTNRAWVVGPLGRPAFEQLASRLTGSELQSVLIDVMQRRASARKPRDLLAQYQRDPFCAPAEIDLRTLVALDGHLLAAAESFEGIELAPVAPLGASSVVAPTSQNRVLSATRMTEVVSDPTNVLALECALRLRTAPDKPVHLATSQRVVRTQPVPRVPGYAQHFRMFALASAGREETGHGFTVSALLHHIRTMLAALDRLERQGYAFGERRIDVLTTPERQVIGDRVVQGLDSLVTRRALEHPYYSGGVRYQISVAAPDGTRLPLVDGGTFDWLARISSNARAVFVATGTGSQLIALRFRR
jgi:hypothetical protein